MTYTEVFEIRVAFLEYSDKHTNYKRGRLSINFSRWKLLVARGFNDPIFAHLRIRGLVDC